MSPRIPPSTYRLQFRDGVGFSSAASLAGYLDALGVGALYASPLLAATRGSTHGYDVTDPTRLDPVLGSRAEFDAMSRTLRDHGIGLVLDIVPNHMAASVQNPWWNDVLRAGRTSRYAAFFDIDWDVHGGKVMLPVLAEPYARALERSLRYDSGRGKQPSIVAGGLRLPVAGRRVSHPKSVAMLDALVGRQNYIPAFWRWGVQEINYRRFFDISDLVCVRAQDRRVYDATHDLIVRLVSSGAVTGLRVDHIDGLADPRAYLDALRVECAGTYLLVEKILGHDEDLPAGWPCDGTTGYEFAVAADDVFVDPGGLQRLAEFAASFTAEGDVSFLAVEREAKQFVLRELFAPDIARLTRMFLAAARQDPSGRDLPEPALRRALEAVTVALEVYRTYLRGGEPTSAGLRPIRSALAEARAALGPSEEPALHFVEKVLTGDGHPSLVEAWQQLTGPVTAKGVEDTALYRYHALISRNEVGADPGVAPDPERLHRLNATRARRWPGALNSGTTHDTKRSEDVRARLDVLAEIPQRWEQTVRRWSGRLAGEGKGPGRAMELLAYQTVLGAWPLQDGDLRDYPDRIAAYLRKAAREAKLHTSWLDPDEAYERRLDSFARRLVADPVVRRDVKSLLRTVGLAGAINSLSSVALRMTSPGVPDVYQGTELWTLTLVDPDNRRPVDFDLRRQMLASLPDDPAGLLRTWQDGRVKLFVTTSLLRLRRADAEVFERGSYTPLRASGRRAAHVFAFARRRRKRLVVTVVPRLVTTLSRPGVAPVGEGAWAGTTLRLPAGLSGEFTDVLTGRRVPVRSGVVRLRDALERFPLAVLTA